MKKLTAPFIILIMVTALSAQQDMDLQNISIGGKYSIMVPRVMVKTTSLNDIASLQYNAPEKELYSIVIDESMSSLLNSNLKLNLGIYFKMACFNIATGLADFNIIKITASTRGNLQIMQSEFTGFLKSNNIGIYYKVAVIQSPTSFYQIFTWTLKNQQEQYQDVFQSMIDSFREISGPKQKELIDSLK